MRIKVNVELVALEILVRTESWLIDKFDFESKLNFVCLFHFPGSSAADPDRIVRIDSSERIQLNGLDQSSSRRDRLSNKRKSKKHASTPRRREVLLSKISIYIVYMFVCCHRYNILKNLGVQFKKKGLFHSKKISNLLKWRGLFCFCAKRKGMRHLASDS